MSSLIICIFSIPHQHTACVCITNMLITFPFALSKTALMIATRLLPFFSCCTATSLSYYNTATSCRWLEYHDTTTTIIIMWHSMLTLGKASWLSSSCRFLMILRTRVLQANGSHRIMDRSLQRTKNSFIHSSQVSSSVHEFKSSVTRGLAPVLSSLHPGNPAALWLASRPQTSHGCRHLNTKWTVTAHTGNT